MNHAPRADVSVVIPTRNGGPRLKQVLARVESQRTRFRVERILIDSGSTDDSLAGAKDRGFQVLTIDPREFNHGATRDRAIAKSQGDFIVLLVQDAVPVDDAWLENLCAPLLEDSAAAGAFSKQVPIPGGNPILEERLKGWIAGMDQARRSKLADPRQWEVLSPLERLHLVAFDNVSSCVRRTCWAEHPFGQRPFGEDVAWATWAIRQGYAIRYEPSSVIEHSHDRSAWYETRRIYCDHRNLNELLGMITVPLIRDARRSQAGAYQHYLGILERSGISAEERTRRRRWAWWYSCGEVLAQWLAPRVNRAGARGFLGWIDRRIRRGI